MLAMRKPPVVPAAASFKAQPTFVGNAEYACVVPLQMAGDFALRLEPEPEAPRNLSLPKKTPGLEGSICRGATRN